MLQRLLFFLALLSPLAATPRILAAEVALDAGCSVSIPDGWETLGRDVAELADPDVKRLFDCLDESVGELKVLGWKKGTDNALQGAFCLRYRKDGMGKVLGLLKQSAGKERDEAAGRVIDAFAGDIHASYGRRDMRVTDMSGDMLDAGDGVIMILDGKIQGAGFSLMRSTTAILHGDSLVHVGVVYVATAPPSVVEQLEELPLTVKWKK
jgi:hypothetical protein